MSTKLQKDVAQYIAHFRAKHQKIRRLRDPLQRKLLIVTMLSALAEGRYPKVSGDKSKFVSLIENDSDWAHATFVSISQLEMMLKKHGATGLSRDFVQEVSRLYTGWRKRHSPWAIVGLADDPKREDIFLAPSNKEEAKLANAAKHSSLLYTYRCKLVHEFREPGHGMEMSEQDTPYYHSMMDSAGQNRTMELVYPTTWFVGLVLPILARLEAHYVGAGINPYGSYRFGSPWA